MPIYGTRPLKDGESFALVAERSVSVTQMAQAFAMVVYGPPAARAVDVGESFALVPYSVGIYAPPRSQQAYVLIPCGNGVPDPVRSRAWWFTLDGHTFYVLDLGQEGTYVYDMITQQWSRWYTDGFEGAWNMKAGTMWNGLRAVAGDTLTGQVWVVDPTTNMDEGWREVQHVVTGGIMLRGRVYVGMSTLNLVGSAGDITSDTGQAEIRMRFSDDMGKTWSDYYAVAVSEGDFSEETAWRSLGSFANPGRIIEISDVGGTIRIDGLDTNLNGFDSPPHPSTGG